MTEIPPPPPYGMPPAPGYQPAPQGKGMAIAAMVLGIVSVVLCPIPFLTIPAAVVAIILGLIARRRGPGAGLAITGVITGVVGALIGALLLAISLGAFGVLDKICDDNPDTTFCEQRDS